MGTAVQGPPQKGPPTNVDYNFEYIVNKLNNNIYITTDNMYI